MERRFIKSGIPGMDEVLGGGFLDGSIVTVSGPTGCGKSTLGAQFVYHGATQFNEPGLYIAIEENRDSFLFHLSGYGWDFQKLELGRKFVLLDYPIHEVDQIVSQSGAIMEIINSMGVRRVVIDSIMPIALFFKNEDERKTGFLKFMENIRKWRTTTLIISEDLKMGNSEVKPNTEFGIESYTDGWVNLFYRYDEKSMERKRYLEVVKMKGVKHSTKTYPVELDDNGFRIVGSQSGGKSVGSGNTQRPSLSKMLTGSDDISGTKTKPLSISSISSKLAAAKSRLTKRK